MLLLRCEVVVLVWGLQRVGLGAGALMLRRGCGSGRDAREGLHERRSILAMRGVERGFAQRRKRIAQGRGTGGGGGRHDEQKLLAKACHLVCSGNRRDSDGDRGRRSGAGNAAVMVIVAGKGLVENDEAFDGAAKVLDGRVCEGRKPLLLEEDEKLQEGGGGRGVKVREEVMTKGADDLGTDVWRKGLAEEVENGGCSSVDVRSSSGTLGGRVRRGVDLHGIHAEEEERGDGCEGGAVGEGVGEGDENLVRKDVNGFVGEAHERREDRQTQRRQRGASAVSGGGRGGHKAKERERNERKAI